MAKIKKAKNGTAATLGFEATLWQADMLRSNNDVTFCA